MGLRVVVCVKWVPDVAGERGFLGDGRVDREGVDGVLSELDEYAVEQGLRLVEGFEGGGEVVVVSVGPEGARDAVRKALSMGVDRGVHVVDEGVVGSDVMGTSLVVAEAVRRVGFDVVVCGMASTDGGMGVLPALLAERLGVAQVSLLSEVSVVGGVVRGRRDDGVASLVVEAGLPAVVSVTDQSGEVRYPSFKGIMAAKKKPVEVWGLGELGVDGSLVGSVGALTVVDEVVERPARVAGTVVEDAGEGGVRIAEFLAERKLL
ncbi:electron transfer flavoprotein subunit beta/FixA family protein [Streptomyces sp. LE64]|uniref:electron transfer flavoprotein subunit beta/FixA family protein n=1 Tax=Streptomyces sp. LE64 TaxID=3448653 RepID=UPI0040437801